MASKSAELWLKIKTTGEEALDKAKKNFEKFAEVAATSMAALGAILTKSIADFREQEQATNRLTQAMINNGIYTKQLKDDYVSQASALQKLTLFGDEQIIAAQAAVQQQIGQVKVTKELTMAILDFAQAQGVDAASAAELVGKSIGTGTNALARYGIEVNTAASSAEKMSQVLTGLNSKFGGQAQAATQGLGAFKQLENAVSDLFEVIGERVAPVLSLFANQLKSIAEDTGQTTGAIDALVGAFQILFKAGAMIAEMFRFVGTQIGTTIGSLAASFSAIMSGNFSQLKEIAKMEIEETKKNVTDRWQAMTDQLNAIDQAFSTKKQENAAVEEQRLVETLQRSSEIKKAHLEAERMAELERQIVQQEEDMAMIGANEQQKLDAQIAAADRRLQQATTDSAKMAAMNEKYRLNEQKKELKLTEFQKQQETARLQGYSQFFGGLAALQASGNKQLASAGKAAAIAQATIDAYVAIQKALASVPYPANIAAAAGIGVQAFANVSKIAGVQLAEGGIVKARPGGIQATIGEGGRDEAVIPLDKAGNLIGGFGGGVQITVYGGLLGDEASAYQFALAVDRELLRLRQNNQSLAFDSGVV